MSARCAAKFSSLTAIEAGSTEPLTQHDLERLRACVGSKEAIYELAQVIDGAVAYPTPGYPVYERGALFGGREVPIMEYADWSDTNRNEAISRVTSRVPRLYMRGGEVVEVLDYMD